MFRGGLVGVGSSLEGVSPFWVFTRKMPVVALLYEVLVLWMTVTVNV